MKLAALIIKLSGACLGALGGLITFMIGLFSDKALAGTATIGLAILGICAYLVGKVLESDDIKELFPMNSSTTSHDPQESQQSSTQQGFYDTLTYGAPQQSAPTQPISQQSESTFSSQQSFNESMQSANQSYQNSYSFDTPADPQ